MGLSTLATRQPGLDVPLSYFVLFCLPRSHNGSDGGGLSFCSKDAGEAQRALQISWGLLVFWRVQLESFPRLGGRLGTNGWGSRLDE